MTDHYIQVENISNTISKVSLQLQERHNALSLELMEELCETFKKLETTSCRVVIIESKGATFCSGLDLKQAADESLTEKIGQQLALLFTILHETPLVTIAAVQGHAIGGGGGLAASCDIVIMSKDAKIGFPEVRRGLVAALVSTILQGQLSTRSIKELLFTGELIDSGRAVEIGLVNRAVEAKDLQQEVLSCAQAVVKGAPQALKRTKRLLKELEGRDFTVQLQHALSLYYEVRASQEAKEGIAAFLDKRSQ